MATTLHDNDSTSTRQCRRRRRRRARVLLGVTGSVAAVKAPQLAVKLIHDLQMDVTILLTQGGANFWSKAQTYDPINWNELQRFMMRKPEGERDHAQQHCDGRETEAHLRIYTANDEWKGWNQLGDSVLHIELRNWADVCVLAPLSAHSLAKVAHGLCDDTLSCVLRAWDYGQYDVSVDTATADIETNMSMNSKRGKQIIMAPAMNTAMWLHPLTQRQLETIQSFWNSTDANGVCVVEPQEKTLACGEVGTGALAPIDDIVEAVRKCCSRLDSDVLP